VSVRHATVCPVNTYVLLTELRQHPLFNPGFGALIEVKWRLQTAKWHL